MKNCLKCGTEIDSRKKYCSTHCKYWYNVIKKEKECHLPPFKKRNANFFSMIVGYERAKIKGGLRQGRRSGHTCVGSMSAMVNCTIEKWVEITPENLKTHFSSISFYKPSGIRLGNGMFVKTEDIEKATGVCFDV